MLAQDPNAIALGATDANAIALPGPPASAPPAMGFTPAAVFGGAKPCVVFKSGAQGTGYYPDSGLLPCAPQPAAAAGKHGMTLAVGHTWLYLCICYNTCYEQGVCASP